MPVEEKDQRASDPVALDATQGLPLTSAQSSRPTLPGSPGFASGDIVAERYRIVRLIGEGGMGEVYEAEDLLLRERVALKTVRHEVASDEKVVERFKREIQLARKVTHPNVCRIFDVGLHRPISSAGLRPGGTRSDIAFLTMELLEGETLAARLTRLGRLSLGEAAPLAAQMGAALDAAHSAGIVHRDFKSANVMLVNTGGRLRAVVTDFGLARGKQAATDPTITGDGGVVGSPSYMAPEQVEGKEVTGAADIYALGIVLYETVCGRLPFVGESPLSTAVMRLREDPVTPCAHVSGLDSRWEHTILKCLRRNPLERPRNAREVAEALAGPAPKRGRTGFVVGALAVGAAAAVMLFLAMQHGSARSPRASSANSALAVAPAAPIKGRRAVAVMGFKNLSGRADAAWITGALTEMIATELSAGADVRVISGESVARAKRELALGDEVSFAPDTLAKLHTTLDADYVLTGSYMALGKEGGGRLRLDLRLVDTLTGESSTVVSETGAEADLVELVARTGETLRSRLSLGALTETERVGARAAQPRADVARLYAEGLAQMRVSACSAARAPLEQAVAVDPNFPLARSTLAEALACLGHDDRALAEAKKAAELSTNLPDQIRFATEARLFQISRQPEKAMERYEQLFRRFPDNFDYGIQLGNLQLRLLREKELTETLAALRRLPPPAGNNPRIDLLDAHSYVFAGKLEEGLRRVQEARAHAEQQGLRLVAADAQFMEAWVLSQLERPDEALQVLLKARATFEAANDLDGIAKTLSIEAAVREGQGDTKGVLEAEAQVENIARNLDNPRQMLSFKFMLGLRLAGSSKIDAALRAFDDAAEIAQRVNDGYMRAATAFMSSMMYLMHGEPAAAEQRVRDVPTDALTNDARSMLLLGQALIAAVRDDSKKSQELLAAAMSLASPGEKKQVMVLQAMLHVDEDRFDEAEREARAVIADSPVLAAMGRLILADALIGQKRQAEALAILDQIDKNQLRGQVGGELMVALCRARARPDVEQARRELVEITGRAEGQGARSSAMEARFALAKLEIERGNAKQGKVLLAAVGRDADALGYRRLARKARALL